MEEWQQVTRKENVEIMLMEWPRYGRGGLFYYTEGDRYLGQWRRGMQQGVGTLFR